MMWMNSFDVLRDDPIDRWYEIGNVITVVDAKLEAETCRMKQTICWHPRLRMQDALYSAEARKQSEKEIENTVSHLNACNGKSTVQQKIPVMRFL